MVTDPPKWILRRILPLLCALVTSCAPRPGLSSSDAIVLRFAQVPLGGDPAPLRGLVGAFERENPGARVSIEVLPANADVAHQYFLTVLEAGAGPDVFAVDVVWVMEFARAGWIDDVSDGWPPSLLRRDVVPGPVEAVVQGRSVHAVPWFVDVGLLYYRSDLVERPPRTYAELAELVAGARARRPELQGFVWQGRQYEGLVCNFYEAVWGHAGQASAGEGLLLDAEPQRAALGWLRDTVRLGISPPSVVSSAEEQTRRVFQSGRAIFMRNWPYAWRELQAEGSPVRGSVGYAPLPSLSGEPGPGALGGWQLAVKAGLPPIRRRLAMGLVRRLTSPEANRVLAVSYGRNPALRASYQDPEVQTGAPFIASLRSHVERARPRPVTPYYGNVADTLQGELSGAVLGIRAPAAALSRAQVAVDRITGVAR